MSFAVVTTPARPLSKTTLIVVSAVAMVLTGVVAGQGLLLGLGLIAAIVLALVVLQYPAVGAAIVVAGVPVLSGLKRGVPVPGLRPSELLVGTMALLVLLPAYRRETQPWRAVDLLALLYAVASVVVPAAHLVLRGQPVTFTVMSSMFLPLQFLLLYRTVQIGLAGDEQRRLGMRLLLLASLGVSAIAVAQQLDLGPTRSLVQRITGSDALDSASYAAYARATGPFQHWHPLAGYATVIMLLAAALLLEPQQQIMSRRGLLVVLGAAGAALMLSVTFTSMFGVLIGGLLLGHWTGRLRSALVGLGVATAIAGVVFGSYVVTRLNNQYVDANGQARHTLVPQTIDTRLYVWQNEYLPGLAGRWAAGYGPDLPPDVRWTHTESEYVTLLLRGGLPLLAVYVALLLELSRQAAVAAADDPHRRAAARTLRAVIASLWLMQFLYPYLTSSGMPQVLWTLAALVFAGWVPRQSYLRPRLPKPTSATRQALQPAVLQPAPVSVSVSVSL